MTYCPSTLPVALPAVLSAARFAVLRRAVLPAVLLPAVLPVSAVLPAVALPTAAAHSAARGPHGPRCLRVAVRSRRKACAAQDVS